MSIKQAVPFAAAGELGACSITTTGRPHKWVGSSEGGTLRA